jgi:hypothetical protein
MQKTHHELSKQKGGARELSERNFLTKNIFEGGQDNETQTKKK